jgi:hypothetical protein
MNKVLFRSFLNALGTALYVALVAIVMQNGERIFGQVNKILGSIAFLLLFLVSATVTASLVLGKPLLMYLEGEKSKAIQMFLFTVGWLTFCLVVLLVVNVGL